MVTVSLEKRQVSLQLEQLQRACSSNWQRRSSGYDRYVDGWILKLFLPDWSSKCRQTDPRKSTKINVRLVSGKAYMLKGELVRLGFLRGSVWFAFWSNLFLPPVLSTPPSHPLSIPGGSGEVARKKRTTGLVRDLETKRSSRKLLDSSLLNLAGQLRRTNRVRWSWRLAFEISRTKVSIGRPRKVELLYDGKTFNSEKH